VYLALHQRISRIPYLNDLMYISLLLLTVCIMSSSTYNPFIYFKF
jgi:hypothetical protein